MSSYTDGVFTVGGFVQHWRQVIM